ncbi:MAG: putative DNA binding domain-containing protein [Deltaproteobacteria bacterium]|nr:putative DNA binding domain-containing protein [Deltaproteobacteria bacterium]
MSTDELLTQPEGKTLEAKRDLSSLRPVLKTLVAFANTAGGTLVVGRADDGTVVGLSDPHKDGERLANVVAEGISPALLPDIETVQAGRKTLLVVRVARWPGPFFLRAEGPDKGVYVRLGSTTRRADAVAIAEMKRIDAGLAFDQAPCLGAEIDDLDIDAARKAFERVGHPIDLAKLQGLGVLIRYGKDRVPSNGGVILFGRDEARARFLPDAQVRCARFRGPEKVHFLDRLDVEGSVLGAIEEASRFVARNTRLAAKIEGLRRQDIAEYPRVALREALVNAVAHTDYAARGSQIMVAVFSDRIEIQNPGQLPFGMTVDDIKAGVSHIRNRVIARVLRELGYMETWGTGYKRMREDCEAGGYPLPEWVELGRVTRTVFRPHPQVTATEAVGANVGVNVGVNVGEATGVPADLNERQRWFINGLARGAKLNAVDLAHQFQKAMRTAQRDIATLQQTGRVEFVGAPKTGFYRLREPK